MRNFPEDADTPPPEHHGSSQGRATMAGIIGFVMAVLILGVAIFFVII